MKNAEIIAPVATDALFGFSTTVQLMELSRLLQQSATLQTCFAPTDDRDMCGELPQLLQAGVNPPPTQLPSQTAAHYLAILIAQDQIALGRML